MNRSQLTTRESDVVTLLAEGKKNVEIAAALWITPGTVRTHLGHVYAKLDVHSRTAAVAQVYGLASGRQ
jgi:DNA-binding CsgD family transcriptional regulator